MLHDFKYWLKKHIKTERNTGNLKDSQTFWLVILADDWEIVAKATTQQLAQEHAEKQAKEHRQSVYIFKSEIFLKHTLKQETEEIKCI